MEKNNYLFIFAAVLMVLIAVLATNLFEREETNPDVMASFYPFYDITQRISGEEIDVEPLVPPGTEPHSFELSPSDRMKVEDAKVFISTGVSFERWEEEVTDSVDTRIVDSSKGIELLEAEHEHSHDHDEGNDHHDHEHYGDYDTHYWVSPTNAKIIAENIKEALIEEFPEKSEEIERNAEQFMGEMDRLDEEFETRLSGCDKDTIVTAHAAFAYLGNDYDFSQVPIHGISPMSEPTPSQIEEIIKVTEEKELQYIFYEELVDPRVAENIAEESGVETLVLNPVAGSVDGAEGYVPIMERNLGNLERALECSP